MFCVPWRLSLYIKPDSVDLPAAATQQVAYSAVRGGSDSEGWKVGAGRGVPARAAVGDVGGEEDGKGVVDDEVEMTRYALLLRTHNSAHLYSLPVCPCRSAFRKKPTQRGRCCVRACSYNYSIFHIMMSLAAMYVAMMLTGWHTMEGTDDNLVLDRSLASVRSRSRSSLRRQQTMT